MKTPARQPTPHRLVDASSKSKPISAPQTVKRDAFTATAHNHTQTLEGHSPKSRPSRSEPHQILIRRVQTVIEVPVKEEVDDASLDLFSNSVESTAETRFSKERKPHTQTKDTADSRLRRDESEVEEDSAESHYSADFDEDNDEEDDELRIGTEVCFLTLFAGVVYECAGTLRTITRSSMVLIHYGHVRQAMVLLR
jgi:hypothetical protein